MTQFRWLWEIRGYLRQVAGELVIGSLGGIVMNVAVVLPAILLGRAVDAVLAFDRGGGSAGAVQVAALAYIGGMALHQLPRVVKRYWLMTANQRITANVRADALRGAFAWPLARLQGTAVGDLMARIIGDVETMRRGINEVITETWDTLLFEASLAAAMAWYDWWLTLLALAPVLPAMLLAHVTGGWVSTRTRDSREANAELTAALQERLTGLRVLRLFGRRGQAVEQIAGLSERYARANLALIRLRDGLEPVYTTLMTAGAVLVVWIGGEHTIAGALSAGGFVAYLQLYLQFVRRGFRVPQMLNSIQSGGAAFDRLRPLLAPPLAVVGEPRFASFRPVHVAGVTRVSPRAATSRRGAAAVALWDVTFRYEASAAAALEGISLVIAPGALVGVTGRVGSGKSALARVVAGVLPVEAGAVLVDGEALAGLPALERAARVAYLGQDGYLFSGSVRENIAMGEGGTAADDLAALEAITLAALGPEVASWPAGLDTQIGEHGVRVSGGQRQRIALARALASSAPSRPGLLVLDDPFSAVDVGTEARIVAALVEAFGVSQPPERRATIIICSHRLAAFPRADLVVVLDEGRIVEQGTHSALLAADGLYGRIYRAQQALEGAEAPVERAR